MEKRRSVLQRLVRFGAIGLAALGMMTVMSGAALADSACSSGSKHVICFSIIPAGGDQYDVHVGIDIKMSRSDAQAIIDQVGDPADAWAMGDDPVFDNAEFNIRVPYAALDEDSDGGDELYARVRLFDQRSGTRTFKSPTLSSPFN
jgi:hypothetical protein